MEFIYKFKPMSLYITSYIILSICCLICINLVLLNKKKIENISGHYDPIQKLHGSYIPPLGGVIIFINYLIYLYVMNLNSFFLNFNIIIPSILIILVGLKEDLFSNVKPKTRFLTIFLASFIFIYNCDSLPSIDIDFINTLFYNFPLIEILFYTLGLTTLSNGLNMVDGVNGLAGFSVLSILIGLISLLLINGLFLDLIKIELISLTILVIIFLFYNFPYGKIFLGDAGAYWLGWILGAIIITVFSLEKLHTWQAVLILIYPTLEAVFSFIRKLIQKKDPTKPDLEHIHLKLYYKLKGPVKRSNEFNSFTTLCLMPLWFTPCLIIIWANFYSHIAIIGIIFIILLYIYFYQIIPKTDQS